MMRGARLRAENREREQIALAWTIAALERRKRLPSLKRLLSPPAAEAPTTQELEDYRREFERMKAAMTPKVGGGARGD